MASEKDESWAVFPGEGRKEVPHSQSVGDVLREPDPGSAVSDTFSPIGSADQKDRVMDTLENRWTRTTINGQTEFHCVPPTIWRNKSAKDVHREQYPELQLKENPAPPISSRVDVDYCRSFSVAPYRGENSEDSGVACSHLTEID